MYYNVCWYYTPGLFNLRHTLKSRNLVEECSCLDPERDAYRFRRALLCKRDDPTSDFDNRRCISGECEECRNLQKLVGKGGCGSGTLICREELAYPFAISWDKWANCLNPVTGDIKKDFKTVKTSARELIADLNSTIVGFNEHHDLMKWMGRDKAYKRRHFVSPNIHTVMDYSENGTFMVRFQHQSRYYQTWQYTLFGIIVDRHLETISNISDAERKALMELFDEQGLPHIITKSHLIISPDTTHCQVRIAWHLSRTLLYTHDFFVCAVRTVGSGHAFY